MNTFLLFCIFGIVDATHRRLHGGTKNSNTGSNGVFVVIIAFALFSIMAYWNRFLIICIDICKCICNQPRRFITFILSKCRKNSPEEVVSVPV